MAREADVRPCSVKSRSSISRKRGSMRSTCEEFVGIVEKFGLSCEGDGSVKLRKLKKSQSDFLNDLERFIEREMTLRVTGREFCGVDGDLTKADVQLRVMREAFLVVQQNIPSYRSVLARVKDSYEKALAVRDKRLKEFEIMRTALLKMQRDVEGQKAAIWEDAMRKVVALHHEKLELIALIDAATVEKNEMKAAVEELEQELRTNHSRLMEEIDARRLVAYEYAQLTEQVEILRNKAKAVVQHVEKTADTDSSSDPVILQIALNKARESLSKAQTRITYMETVYDTVCPLRDYDNLLALYKEQEKAAANVVAQMAALEKDMQNLERQLTETNVEKQQLLHRMNAAKAGTPRWDWSQCAQFIEGGTEAWSALSDGKRSREKFAILMEELAKPREVGEAFLIGRGLGADVPPYLRFEGQVRNRRFWLRDVRIIINDIWRSKISENNTEAMSAFIVSYAESAYPVNALRMEFIYNLIEGCRKYLFDPQVKLFHGILTNAIQEDVYHAQYGELKSLEEEMKRKLTSVRSKTFITGAAFCETLRQMFPLKTETEVMALLDAATTQLGVSIGKSLNVLDLFAESEEGIEQRELGREMGEQFRAVQKKYVGEVVHCITNVTVGRPEVTVDMVRDAFGIVDPGLDYAQLNVRLKWLFAVEDLSVAKGITLEELTGRLERGNIRRINPTNKITFGV